jgi:hypothetical protein
MTHNLETTWRQVVWNPTGHHRRTNKQVLLIEPLTYFKYFLQRYYSVLRLKLGRSAGLNVPLAHHHKV